MTLKKQIEHLRRSTQNKRVLFAEDYESVHTFRHIKRVLIFWNLSTLGFAVSKAVVNIHNMKKVHFWKTRSLLF